MDLNHTLSQSVIYKPVSLDVQTTEEQYLQQTYEHSCDVLKLLLKLLPEISQNTCNVMYKNQKTFIFTVSYVLYNHDCMKQDTVYSRCYENEFDFTSHISLGNDLTAWDILHIFLYITTKIV